MFQTYQTLYLESSPLYWYSGNAMRSFAIHYNLWSTQVVRSDVSGQCGHWTVMVLWARQDLSRARTIVLYLFNWDQASYLWGSAVTAVLCFPSPQPRKMHYLPQWIADAPMVTKTSFKGLDQLVRKVNMSVASCWLVTPRQPRTVWAWKCALSHFYSK